MFYIENNKGPDSNVTFESGPMINVRSKTPHRSINTRNPGQSYVLTNHDGNSRHFSVHLHMAGTHTDHVKNHRLLLTVWSEQYASQLDSYFLLDNEISSFYTIL